MDVVKQFRTDIEASKRKRQDYVDGWQLNVNERRGKDFATAADEGRSTVPMDWSITKAKAAQLFSQVPQVRLSPKHEAFAPAVPIFAKVVNDILKHANVEAVVSECVVDCVNAAGIGAAIVRYESLSETVEIPAADPMLVEEAAALPQLPATRVTDRRFCIDRISPSDLLWPVSFRLSDWNKAPWLGHSNRVRWATGKRMFNLHDEDKDKIVGAAGDRKSHEQLNNDPDARGDNEWVVYDELFYWRHIYHEDEKYYDAIHHLVFVAGLEEPVINEPWKGQKFDEVNGGYTGSCRLPIQALTLAYISDEAIPPSDSAIIRPQVKELQESRQHMKDQRKHSRPLRWFNVDLVDPSITGDLLRGTWQGMIPVIGAGDRVIGEVARSAYPRENLEFDRILKADIQEAVSVGPNQSGTFASGERSASEAQIIESSFQTEIGQQRARVAAFFVGLAEVAAGLFALYGVIEPTGIGATIGPEGEQRLQAWDRTRINQKFVFDVRPDSTVRLDAQQLVRQLTQVLNVTAQSGFINPKPLIQRIVELNGLDPAEVMVDPTPKPPEKPKISYSFSGAEILHPVTLAILMEAGQAPSPQALKAAMNLLASVGLGASPMPSSAPGEESAPMPPVPPGAGAPDASSAPPQGPPTTPDLAYPDWEASPRINTRRDDGSV